MKVLLRLAPLAISVTLAAFISLSASAQSAYTSVPGHDPIWAVSAYGGYYDATGVIQGTVAARDLYKYGGRFVDGSPVSGAAKVRDADGNLLSEEQYLSYRQQLSGQLSQYNQQLASLQSGQNPYGLDALQLTNLQQQIRTLQDNISTLDGRYPQYHAANGIPQLPPGTIPTYPYAKAPGGSLKQELLDRGRQFFGGLNLQ
jgi:hypothetical protein